jgi:DNA repair photolyase
MSVIYEPKGKAREYSPLALNLYLSCTHKCKYCYAPGCLQKSREAYFQKPDPRKDLAENLEKELTKKRPIEQVLLSFIGDVYCESLDNGELTTEVLKILSKNKVPTAILTKGGKRCLKDIELFKEFGEHFHIGATLTFYDKAKSQEWEAGAADPEERLEVLKYLHDTGIKTFASFEPVIEPDESIRLIKRTLQDNSIDTYKIGKINNYLGIDKTIDWTKFLQRCLDLLRPAGKSIYIKHDLRKAAPSIKLYGNEVLSDEHNVS